MNFLVCLLYEVFNLLKMLNYLLSAKDHLLKFLNHFDILFFFFKFLIIFYFKLLNYMILYFFFIFQINCFFHDTIIFIFNPCKSNKFNIFVKFISNFLVILFSLLFFVIKNSFNLFIRCLIKIF